jgi:NAD(P)-dependent dehydrogenase (short-subunit alcohol dehydrogenase family)
MSRTSSPYAPDLLAGKRILITGGGTGLGRGVARHLVEHSAQVHLRGRRSTVLEDATLEASADHPGTVHYQTVDVRDGDGVDAAMGELWEQYGPLTGVVNNAAANFIAPTEMLNPTDKSSVGATQADQIPMGRTGTAEELANLTMFLLSDACPYLTGQTIAMDGGQMLAGPGTFAGLTSLSADGAQLLPSPEAAELYLPPKRGARCSRKAARASGISSVRVSRACPRFSSSSAAA